MTEHKITEELVTAFSKHLRREERAETTVQKYLHDLEAFQSWLQNRPLTKEAVTEWKEALCRQGRAPVTVNSALAALHSFFSFAGWEDCRVRYLKIQRQLFRDSSRELSRKEYTHLVTTARQKGNVRLALLLETICGTGVRVSEVRYITVEALRRGRADIALKGKIRTILIPEKLARKLRAYARKKRISDGEIFLNRSGKPMTRGQIWLEMKRICAAAGICESKVFPHNLRHLFARVFYDACRDIVRLADILGHSSVETTRIYLITTGAEYARKLNQLGLIL